MITGYPAHSSPNPILGILLNIFIIIISVIVFVGYWNMYKKARYPGWVIFIPFYNLYILLKIVGQSGWGLLLYFVPIVNIIYEIYIAIRLAKVFGKGALFGVFLNFIFPVGPIIIGFGSAKFRSPKR